MANTLTFPPPLGANIDKNMATRTHALIIGVTEYQDENVEELPAAQIDAVDIARALSNWGIPEENISIFLNRDATEKNINRYFFELSNEREPFHFLLYFCGHGFRTKAEKPQSFLLLFDSYFKEEKCYRALRLEKLIKKTHQIQTIDSYIFIDACYLRLNTIPNPKLDEELQGEKTSKKGFFCLLSSGIESSFEDEEGHFGYFTQALMKSLSRIRGRQSSPTTLLELIHEEMKGQDLPLPEMYNIAIQKMDFLPDQASPYVLGGKLVRPQVFSKLQDILTANRKTIVVLHGEKGSGKRTIMKQMCSEKLRVFSLQWNQNTLHEMERLEQEYPFAWVFLDCLSLEPQKFSSCFQLIKNKRLRLICLTSGPVLSKQREKRIYEYELPSWTAQEVQVFSSQLEREHSEKDIEFIHLAAQGNPGKVCQLLCDFSVETTDEKMKQAVKKAIAALCSSGIYLNEHLFCKTHKIEPRALSFLEEMGMITHEDGCSLPHDFLFEVAESEKLEIKKDVTLEYWRRQIEELPHHQVAARNFIITVECFGYEKKFDYFLKLAFQTLLHQGASAIEDFKHGAQIFLSASCLTEAALYLTELLIEFNELSLAKALLELKPISRSLTIRRHVCQAHFLWKSGSFEASAKTSSHLIETLAMSSDRIFAHFHRAVSYFFLGKWEESHRDFSFIHHRVKDHEHLGWARCMLGTINGIRGIEVESSKALLESGARLLMKNQNFSGAWLGWNNLGEVLWKSSDYRLSFYHLKKAFELAEKLSNQTMKLETLRNMLQASFRMEGPFSKQVSEIIITMEELLREQCDQWEQMQIWNTLATLHIFRGDDRKAIEQIKKAIPLTVQSREYHLYTLANMALLFKSKNLDEKAHAFFKRAMDLAKEGKNHFAQKQITEDWKRASRQEVLDRVPLSP